MESGVAQEPFTCFLLLGLRLLVDMSAFGQSFVFIGSLWQRLCLEMDVKRDWSCHWLIINGRPKINYP